MSSCGVNRPQDVKKLSEFGTPRTETYCPVNGRFFDNRIRLCLTNVDVWNISEGRDRQYGISESVSN